VSFVELAAGRVLESGGREFRVSTDGGVHWSEPYTGMDERRKPVDARSLVRLTGSGIGLVTVSYDGGIHQPVLLFRRSEDEGRTWSGSALISSGCP